MIAWRTTTQPYSNREKLLDGNGAKEVGGRWNETGLPLVYASETSSLTILETLAHTTPWRLPVGEWALVCVQIVIPDDAHVTTISLEQLPRDWKEIDNAACLRIGSDWIRSKIGLVLRVPSVTNPIEHNILLNPLHSDIARCEIGESLQVEFDPRLLSFLQLPPKATPTSKAARRRKAIR